MTRRAAAEAMIARYGSPVSCGGAVFPAFVRPARFSASAGERSFSYVGPAAHKLAAGGTVSVHGTDYLVRRCETVLLRGEELFVRAVLAGVPPQAAEVRLERGGAVFARAETCAARAVCGAEAETAWGESAPAEIAEGNAVWKLSLSGLAPEPGAGLFSPEEFRVVAERKNGRTVYGGCRWTVLSEKSGNTEKPARTMEALAVSRAEEAKADG